MNQPDVIVIGSGIGGLTVASLLAQLQKKRVLVLEHHFQPGGYSHSFSRGKYHWDVGLHYVGAMQKTSPLRQVFDLVTDNQVDWAPLPEPFERFSYPGFDFNVTNDPKKFETDLIARFPKEERGIRAYFKDITRAARAITSAQIEMNSRGGLRFIMALGRWWFGKHLKYSTKEYLDAHFRDPLLKAVLASQWGDYGAPPGESAFPVHAMVAHHYLQGAYYPSGGAGTIAESVRKVLEANGGEILIRREVTEIIIENGTAVGVRVRKAGAPDAPIEEYRAPIIISAAGAATTYLRLVPESYPLPFRQALSQFLQQYPLSSAAGLYVGLSADPRSTGASGGNIWIYSDTDHDAMYARRAKALESGTPEHAYVSFPSLRDPKATAHTAEILTFADYDSFSRWSEQPWLRRDEDYKQLKERIADGLLKLVESRLPGFTALVAKRELSTPVTNEHFTGHPRGGVYGLSVCPERLAPEARAWHSVRSPIPGLYLTGVDTMLLPGIVSALVAGVVTFGALPGGRSLPLIFREAASRAKRNGGK
jgi:phytoene dehydrogenase-like protein